MTPLVRAVVEAMREVDASGMYDVGEEHIAVDVLLDPTEFDAALRKAILCIVVGQEAP